MACLGLLLGQLLAEDLQLLHQVPLVLGHREALGLLWQITWRHQCLLGLLLQLDLTAGDGEKELERERSLFGLGVVTTRTGTQKQNTTEKNI